MQLFCLYARKLSCFSFFFPVALLSQNAAQQKAARHLRQPVAVAESSGHADENTLLLRRQHAAPQQQQQQQQQGPTAGEQHAV